MTDQTEERKTTLGGPVREVDDQLVKDIETCLQGTGYSVFGFAPNSVGVQGDGRVVGPVVVLTPPAGSTCEEWGTIGTKLINEVRGITRVMQHLPSSLG